MCYHDARRGTPRLTKRDTASRGRPGTPRPSNRDTAWPLSLRAWLAPWHCGTVLSSSREDARFAQPPRRHKRTSSMLPMNGMSRTNAAIPICLSLSTTVVSSLRVVAAENDRRNVLDARRRAWWPPPGALASCRLFHGGALPLPLDCLLRSVFKVLHGCLATVVIARCYSRLLATRNS